MQDVAGLSDKQLARVRGRLVEFAEEMFESMRRKDQRGWGEVYLRGLMLDGKRKSIEPMAARLADGDEQCLQQFVNQSPWDWVPVRRALARRMTAEIGPEAWVIDDTGFPKFGKHSAGVARQYSGSLGKVGNCQVAVSVNAATDEASCPLDWRLFLPKEWDEGSDFNQDRRVKAGVPEDLQHVEKWRLALEMIDEISGWGITPRVILGDGAYGDNTRFRQGLTDRGLSWVLDVKHTTSAYPEQGPAAETSLQRGPVIAAGARTRRRGGRRGAGDVARRDTRADELQVPGAQGPPGEHRTAPRREQARPRTRCRLADLRVARRQGEADQVLALEPPRGHPDRGSGQTREAPLADRA